MTNTNNYDGSSSLSSYYTDRANHRPARLWSVEKIIHDLAAAGIVEFFEGVGDDPTTLSGYSDKKLWLRLPATGVTTTPATIRRWNGSAPASSLSNWVVMTRPQFYGYITQDLSGLPGSATWINVKDYGVIGDSTTDDLAAIQAIIDNANDGSVIYFPRSTYKVSGAVVGDGTSHNKNNLTFIGDGQNSVIQLANAAETNTFEIVSGDGFRVSDLTIRGNKGTVATAGTDLSFRHHNGLYIGGHHGAPVTNVIVSGVVTKNAAYCGFMVGSGPVESMNIGDGVDGVTLNACSARANVNGLAGGKQINCTYTCCSFLDNEIYGALSDIESTGFTYSGCVFDNARPGATAFNLFFYNCNGGTVTGCTFKNSHYSIVLDNDARNITIIGNSMAGATYTGVVCQNSRYVVISGCSFSEMGHHGVEVRTNVNRVMVSSNNIFNCSRSGIAFDDGFFLSACNNTIELCGWHGVHLNGSSNCTVIGNTCASNGTSGAGYDGIRLDNADSNLVQSNLCIDTQSTKTQEYGVRSTGTTEGTVLQFNRLGGNATGAYVLADASFIADLNGDRVISTNLTVPGPVTGTEIRASSDDGGAVSATSLTSTANLSGNSTGVGTILFKGATSRNSAGFIKIYVGTTAYYVPVFSDVTG